MNCSDDPSVEGPLADGPGDAEIQTVVSPDPEQVEARRLAQSNVNFNVSRCKNFLDESSGPDGLAVWTAIGPELVEEAEVSAAAPPASEPTHRYGTRSRVRRDRQREVLMAMVDENEECVMTHDYAFNMTVK